MIFKIYYLDDETHLCTIFKEFIACNDIKVTTFTDANEAISKCIDEPPDLIFIDYRLSDTTGDKVAQILAENIPKILVTGELISPSSPSFLRVIHKPFKLAELNEVINQCLKVTRILVMSAPY
jgi:DNA-binding response OmpR family regulator